MSPNHLFEKIENSSPIDFGNIFNKSIELFKKVWLQGFIHLLLSMVVIIPLIIVMYIPIIALASIGGLENSYGEYGSVQEELSIGMAILFVVLVIIVSMIASAFQLGVIFAFNPDVNASDLIKASFKFGNKIWLVAFGLIFISSILAQFVGMILCFVGIFFTAYFVYLPIYYMYKDGIGFENESESEDWNALVE